MEDCCSPFAFGVGRLQRSALGNTHGVFSIGERERHGAPALRDKDIIGIVCRPVPEKDALRELTLFVEEVEGARLGQRTNT